MTFEEARKICEEIIEKYAITHSTCNEERVDGRIKFINMTIKFKINKEKGNEVRRGGRVFQNAGDD